MPFRRADFVSHVSWNRDIEKGNVVSRLTYYTKLHFQLNYGVVDSISVWRVVIGLNKFVIDCLDFLNAECFCWTQQTISVLIVLYTKEEKDVMNELATNWSWIYERDSLKLKNMAMKTVAQVFIIIADVLESK